MGNSLTAALLRPKERDVQDAIVAALRFAGFHVMHTSAFRQKGPSGVSKGVPDLLVSIDGFPYWFIGIEVKRPGRIKWSCPEQEENARMNRVLVVQSVHAALGGVIGAVSAYFDHAAVGAVIDRAERALTGLSVD